jgi:hypothetical protein
LTDRLGDVVVGQYEHGSPTVLAHACSAGVTSRSRSSPIAWGRSLRADRADIEG